MTIAEKEVGVIEATRLLEKADMFINCVDKRQEEDIEHGNAGSVAQYYEAKMYKNGEGFIKEH